MINRIYFYSGTLYEKDSSRAQTICGVVSYRSFFTKGNKVIGRIIERQLSACNFKDGYVILTALNRL